MSQMMSAEDFEAKADTILSRVKCGLDTRVNSSSNNNNNNKNSNSGNSDLSSHYCPVCRNLMVCVSTNHLSVEIYSTGTNYSFQNGCLYASNTQQIDKYC